MSIAYPKIKPYSQAQTPNVPKNNDTLASYIERYAARTQECDQTDALRIYCGLRMIMEIASNVLEEQIPQEVWFYVLRLAFTGYIVDSRETDLGGWLIKWLASPYQQARLPIPTFDVHPLSSDTRHTIIMIGSKSQSWHLGVQHRYMFNPSAGRVIGFMFSDVSNIKRCWLVARNNTEGWFNECSFDFIFDDKNKRSYTSWHDTLQCISTIEYWSVPYMSDRTDLVCQQCELMIEMNSTKTEPPTFQYLYATVF